MFEFIKSRLHKKSGKDIILSEEGSGKSTTILKEAVNSTTDSLILYNTHTNRNKNEKYNYISSLKDKNKKLLNFKSNFELFVDMIYVHDSDIASLFRDAQNNRSTYLNYSFISINKSGTIKQLHNSVSFKKKFKALTKQDDSSNYNSIVVQELYNSISIVKGKCDYYIAIKEEHEKPTETLDIDIPDLLNKFSNNISIINTYLQNQNIRLIKLTSNSISNMRGFQIEREKQLDNVIRNPEEYIIFIQNRSTEEFLIPFLEKNNLLNKTLLIVDELVDSDFIYYNNDIVHSIENIASKIIHHGFDSITFKDECLLKDLKIYKELKSWNNSNNITVDLPNIKICGSSHSPVTTSFIGKPDYSKKLKLLNNIIVLTTENFKSEILEKNLSFTKHEFFNFKEYEDSQLFFIPTKGENAIKKDNTEFIHNYIQLLKSNLIQKSDALFIGTRYFGTDYSLQSCKGNNFKNKTNCFIFTNPHNFKYILKYISFVKEYYEEDDIYNYVSKKIRTDDLNQTIARVSGHRRKVHKNTNIEVYYYDKDTITKEAIDDLRYKGKELDSDFIKDRIDYITESNLRNEKIYQEYKEFFRIQKDTCLIRKKLNGYIDEYSIDILRNDCNLTKKGTIYHIQNYMKFAKSQLLNEKNNMWFFATLPTLNDKEEISNFSRNNIENLWTKTSSFLNNISTRKNPVLRREEDYNRFKDYITKILDSDDLMTKLKSIQYDHINGFDISNYFKTNMYFYLYINLLPKKSNHRLHTLRNDIRLQYNYYHTIEGLVKLRKIQEKKSNYLDTVVSVNDTISFNKSISDTNQIHKALMFKNKKSVILSHIQNMNMKDILNYQSKNNITVKDLFTILTNVNTENPIPVEILNYIPSYIFDKFKKDYKLSDIENINSSKEYNLKYTCKTSFTLDSVPPDRIKFNSGEFFHSGSSRSSDWNYACLLINPINMYRNLLSYKLSFEDLIVDAYSMKQNRLKNIKIKKLHKLPKIDVFCQSQNIYNNLKKVYHVLRSDTYTKRPPLSKLLLSIAQIPFVYIPNKFIKLGHFISHHNNPSFLKPKKSLTTMNKFVL